ncbi:MAG TPA: flagellar biosynthesis anti-sigma factor FlgM [Anaerovoracaceae bacterium]|nr:flagellar biosynthesis anti-sigma factor FlgM [Anaerovoracaceae bacterium]
MEISFVNKSKTIQPQQIQDLNNDPARNISTEENKKYTLKNKVDSAEISSSHTGSFDDKRISVAKSAILYDVSVNTSTNRIEDLKKTVGDGSYNVPTNLLADAILKY